MDARSYAGLAAAWRGRELLERRDWTYRLTPSDLAELERGATTSTGRPVESLTRDDLPLPTLAPRLHEIQASLETGPGATLIRGLPVTSWDERTSTAAFWGLASHIGTPLSQSATGERVFHVRDRGYAPSDPRFRGPSSRDRLSFHTDRCDVIAFACLRPARSGGRTFIVSSVTLYEELRQRRPDMLAVLQRPFAYLRHTVDYGNAVPYCQLPVFSSHRGHFAAHFLRVLIDRADRSPEAPSLTDTQREALNTLEALAEDPALHVSFDLEAGDVLLINNWTMLHRRSAFTDAEDPGERRHLLRIWLSVPNSRPLAPCFADHVGATEPGALRGGMRPAS